MTPAQLKHYGRNPVAFIDDFITLNELGQPFSLFPHQRETLRLAFPFDRDGKLPWDTVVLSWIKKSGKTTVNAALVLWWAFTQEAPNEIPVVANDLEQALGRVFKTVVGLLTHNPALGDSAHVTARTVTLSNGTVITAIPSDYAGAAGSNHGLTSWDELWAYSSERSLRLWDELGPVATRRNSIRLITSYAGFINESKLLWGLYTQGVPPEETPEGKGERLHPTLPIYGNRGQRLFVTWDHEARMPWQTRAFLAARQADTRPTAYARQYRNTFTQAESIFITPELWDNCIVPGLRLALPEATRVLYGGIDAGLKSDYAAVWTVYQHEGRVCLGPGKLWRPTRSAPLDLEATIEAFVLDLHQKYSLAVVLCDPWQMARSTQTLQAAGVNILEFPQSTPNTTRMGQVFFDLLTSRTLALYPSAELREQALHTVAVEGPRGFRIAKEKASAKIDGIVALAMACVAAMDHGVKQSSPYPPSATDDGSRVAHLGWDGAGSRYLVVDPSGQRHSPGDPSEGYGRIDWRQPQW